MAAPKIRFLTKSRFFKIGVECARKLAYQDGRPYPNANDENDFLNALGDGGFQAGQIAKLYQPRGVGIHTICLSVTRRCAVSGIVTKDAVTYGAELV